MSTRRLKPVSLALLALLATFASQARAQAAPPADAQAPAPSANAAETAPAENRLESVIVKSQRRVERLQDVPIAVKAFSARQIESTGITSTQDFVNLTPNMSFDNSFTYGNSFVVIRGVTQINNADSPVAVVIDGVPQNNQKQLKMNLFDIERIEVLKGPQGALYGRNAIGGAINIETKKPKNQFEAFGAVEAASGGSAQATAGISGGVNDNVLYRIVAQTKRSNGLIENTYLGQKVDGVDHDNTLRGRLILTPTDDLTLDFRANVTDFRAGAVWDSVVGSSSPNDIQNPRSNLLGKTFGGNTDLSFKADYETRLGTLTSITGYTDLREKYRGDVDFSNPVDNPGGFFGFGFQAGQGQNLSVKMLSQEIRLTSPEKQRLRWIAGGYFLDTRRSLETRAFMDTNGDLGQFDDPGKNLFTLSEKDKNRSYAAFGQLDYDLQPDLTLSTALRHDLDKRHQTDQGTGSSRNAEFSNWQPKVTLTKRFGSDNLAYATYSTGFRSGGFNAPSLPDFKAETLANYELGAKTTQLDGRLILNGALFHSRSKNFQYFYVDATTASQIISNIDRVDIKGLDIDFRYLPMKGLEFDGGVGTTHSTIKENSVDPSTVGNRTPKSVPVKVTLGAQYTAPVARGILGTVRFDYEHRGRKFWHPDNVAVSDPLNLFNLRLGLRDTGDKWSVTAFARNLTNKRYYADYNSSKYSGLPYDIGSLATPRTFGIEAKFRL